MRSARTLSVALVLGLPVNAVAQDASRAGPDAGNTGGTLAQGAGFLQRELIEREAERAGAATQLGERHPEMLRLRGEVDSLRAQLAALGRAGQQPALDALTSWLRTRVAAVERDLAGLRGRYGDRAPPLVVAQARLSVLRAALAAFASGARAWLPAATGRTDSLPVEVLQLEIDDAGRLRFGTQALDDASLAALIGGLRQRHRVEEAELRASPRAPYRRVTDVMDLLRAAGIENVVLGAVRAGSGATPPPTSR